MSQLELSNMLRDLANRLDNVAAVIKPDILRERLTVLENEVQSQGLWDHQENAQAVISELAQKKALLSRIVEIERCIADASVLSELAAQENDLEATQETIAEISLCITG